MVIFPGGETDGNGGSEFGGQASAGHADSSGKASRAGTWRGRPGRAVSLLSSSLSLPQGHDNDSASVASAGYVLVPVEATAIIFERLLQKWRVCLGERGRSLQQCFFRARVVSV